MESHARRRAAIAPEIPAIGVALQAYLHRTSDDTAAMIARGIGIRLVKGAYNEPPAIALPKKADVNTNYVELARRAEHGARAAAPGPYPVPRRRNVLKAIEQHGDAAGLAPTSSPFTCSTASSAASDKAASARSKNVRA